MFHCSSLAQLFVYVCFYVAIKGISSLLLLNEEFLYILLLISDCHSPKSSLQANSVGQFTMNEQYCLEFYDAAIRWLYHDIVPPQTKLRGLNSKNQSLKKMTIECWLLNKSSAVYILSCLTVTDSNVH